MKRSEKDYALPRLTLAEAALALGVREGELWMWLVETMRPGESRLSKWRNDREPLPEAIVRLYLATHPAPRVALPSPDGVPPAPTPPDSAARERRAPQPGRRPKRAKKARAREIKSNPATG